MFPEDVLVLAPYLLIAAADGIPKVNVDKMCHMSVQGSSQPDVDFRGCIDGQNSAHDELAKEWAGFSSADRQRCTSMAISGYLPSYVELLVCLQVSRDVKKLPEDLAQMPGPPSTRRRR